MMTQSIRVFRALLFATLLAMSLVGVRAESVVTVATQAELEARIQDDRVFLLIGIGINVEPVKDDARPNAVAISEIAERGYFNISDSIDRFIYAIDAFFRAPFEVAQVRSDWNDLCVHKAGDPIRSVIGDRIIEGAWSRIDEHGRAVLITPDGELAISAGDLFLA